MKAGNHGLERTCPQETVLESEERETGVVQDKHVLDKELIGRPRSEENTLIAIDLITGAPSATEQGSLTSTSNIGKPQATGVPPISHECQPVQPIYTPDDVGVFTPLSDLMQDESCGQFSQQTPVAFDKEALPQSAGFMGGTAVESHVERDLGGLDMQMGLEGNISRQNLTLGSMATQELDDLLISWPTFSSEALPELDVSMLSSPITKEKLCSCFHTTFADLPDEISITPSASATASPLTSRDSGKCNCLQTLIGWVSKYASVTTNTSLARLDASLDLIREASRACMEFCKCPCCARDANGVGLAMIVLPLVSCLVERLKDEAAAGKAKAVAKGDMGLNE